MIVAIAAAAAPLSAHRRDEYLQAARLAIDPERVEIALDLTPGIAVAGSVLGDIDVDRNGAISSVETRTYAARVMNAVAVQVDDRPLRLDVVSAIALEVDAVRTGEGAIRLRAAAAIPALAAGAHRLHFRNTHRADIGVYLANALVPASERVAITAQRRDVDQHDLMIEYTLRGAAPARSSGWLAIAAGALIGVAVAWITRGRR